MVTDVTEEIKTEVDLGMARQQNMIYKFCIITWKPCKKGTEDKRDGAETN